MKDEELQKPMTVKPSTSKPYYHYYNGTWIIQQTQPSYQCMLKNSFAIANEPKPKKAKTRNTNNNNKGGVSIDEWNKLLRLSNEYGNTYKHPRTSEVFYMVSETLRSKHSLKLRLKEKHYWFIPRVAYKRNQKVTSVKLKINEDGTKEFVENSLWIGKDNKRWKSVYIQTKRKAPRKFNYWSYDRLNFCDGKYIREKQLIERCEYLSKQIRECDSQ